MKFITFRYGLKEQRMEFTKLRYFYEVAKRQHVTKTAEEIHIAQPALTKSIKQLEDELEMPLFYKKGRNIFLTEYGKYLQNKLEGIFAQVDSIKQDLELLKEQQRSTIRLNVLSASTIVTDAVVAYKKKNPSVIFQLIQNEAETDADVSVSMMSVDLPALPAFEKKCVMSEQIYLAVPSDSKYAKRAEIALNDVKEEGFVHLAGSKLFRRICDDFCAQAGFKSVTAFESDSPIAVKNVIGAHAGVGFWPEYSWGKASSEIVLLPITAPVCRREIVVGLHKNPVPSAVAPDFYEFLVKFLQNKRAKKRK